MFVAIIFEEETAHFTPLPKVPEGMERNHLSLMKVLCTREDSPSELFIHIAKSLA